MAETLFFESSPTDRLKRYQELNTQLAALLSGEKDEIACLANTSAAITEAFQFHWVGFYRVDGNNLVLGPFQGPVACSRIEHGKGVCGKAWKNNQTVCVENVHEFPGHIACSLLSQSEIVVPIRNQSGVVCAVLDIDSSELADFSEVDQAGLEILCKMLGEHLYSA
ncbi:MAG TPA: GAF domain-containing protein [Flavobacteriales bacterium]|nr:GAF domain-containing protein [Flavobacteriales bacterium]HPH82070.1 GAF domain-containing protein [Flavobacteriales bacterium]